MKNIITKLYYNLITEKLFHTLVYCLKKELNDCESVLDLGCGPSSPLQFCNKIKYSLGVEIFTPYLKESQKRKIHSQYLNQNIMNLKIAPRSFDAVIMIEVLEHLSKKDGLKLLERAEKWAKKKIIVSTPNGYFPEGKVDQNSWQRHLSGWSIDNFRKLNFKCHGLAGIKFFYHRQNKTRSIVNSGENSLLENIRFKPKNLFFLINSFFQIFAYYSPGLSFELLAVKRIK